MVPVVRIPLAKSLLPHAQQACRRSCRPHHGAWQKTSPALVLNKLKDEVILNRVQDFVVTAGF